jgi:hypothetical protein
MTRRDPELRWIRAATALVLGGAAAWLAKLGVIVVTDGEQTDTGAAAAFYLTGFALLLLGSAALGLWLARHRSAAVRLASVLAGPLVFVVSMNAIDGAAKAVLGDLGPSYARDEWGILFAAIVWLTVGLAVVPRPSSK